MARPKCRSCPVNVMGGEDLCSRCHGADSCLKMIRCGHVFCKACLEPNSFTGRRQEQLPCPECQTFGQSLPVPRAGPRGFSVNASPVSRDSDEEASIISSDQEPSECHSCGADVSGTRSVVCVSCDVILCSASCVKHHMACCGADQAPGSGTCLKHGQQLQQYCRTCRKPLCETCSTDQAHRRHRLQSLSQSADRARKHLETAVSRIEPVLSYTTWVQKDVLNAKQAVAEEKQTVENKIRARAEEARTVVKEIENAALEHLNSLTSELEKQYRDEESVVSERVSALTCKREHLTSTLANGDDATIMNMLPTALDTIKKRWVLGKFTSDLPATIQFPSDHNDTTSELFRTSVTNFIGCPRMQKTKRKVPPMNVVSQLKITLTGPGNTNTVKICSGGTGLLVWVSSSSLGQDRALSSVQLVDMSDCIVLNQQQLNAFAGAPLDLVNVDEESAIASGNQHLVQLSKGRSEPVGQSTMFTVFCKGSLQACLRFSEDHREILPSVSSVQDVCTDDQGVIITCQGMPVSMDKNTNGGIFVVVTNTYQLCLYRRDATRPYSTYPSPKSTNSSAKIVDACFFTVGNQEMLLVADMTEDDVMAMAVQPGYPVRMVGPVTNRSGQLAHPVALNVDPYTGHLLVLCCPNQDGTARLAVCSPTGVPLQSTIAQTLGMFR